MANAFERFFKTGSTEEPTETETVEISNGDKDKRVQGKIIKISEKGWGFITSRDVPFTRIFFHWTSLKQDTIKFTELERGMSVEFTPVELEGKGCRALRINIIPKE